MSREVDLYKDKIEVSLDGRQIFYLFFGGAVIVGLVFVLGVMVGRRVEARGHVDRANVTTTADPLAALDRLESGNRLSFQDSLRGNTTPENDVDRQIAAMKPAAPGAPAKKSDQPKVDEPKKDVAAKVDAKADKKDDAKVEKKADDKAKTDGAKVEKKADDKAKTDGAKLEAKAEKKSDDKAEKKSDDKAEKKADDKAKTDGAKLEAKADPKAEAKKTDDKAKTDVVAKADDKKTDGEKKQKFTLQLSSFQDENEAQAYLDSVKSSGYSAYVTKGDVDGKQFFRVRMGSYKSMEAANEAKSEFEKSAKKSAIVTKL